jgi:holin-like protein
MLLLTFLVAGEAVAYYTGLPVPGSVIGMVLLAVGLGIGLVPLAGVERVADWLLEHLGLFFVPPGVGLMLHWGLLRREWLPILVALVVSTFAVLAVTGLVARLLSQVEPKS